jgi:pimeloyl-ACP methyl ester carboxylesterase
MRAVVLAGVLAFASAAMAEVHTVRIPLRDGKIGSGTLTAALCEKMNLPAIDFGGVTVDLSSFRGGLLIKALNTSLGDGCQVELEPKELVLRVDPAKLPRNSDALRRVARIFTATAAPDATAAQEAMYGLALPAELKPDGRLVVLVHGLDCNRQHWGPMADLLREAGFAVAMFAYPSDGPLIDSAALLARDMTALHEVFPQLRTDIVAFSMGGLVARGYVESDGYVGGVERLIMLGPPNLGSTWTGYRWVLELKEHYGLWKGDSKWSWTWMITDGLGEAGRDLSCDSKFLTHLNRRSRCDEITYTIIAGAQHPAYPWAAWALQGSANVVPARAAGWWGVRQSVGALRRSAERARKHIGTSDGPVDVDRARLEGVTDFVVLPVDHYALYYPTTDRTPAAWSVIIDRLSN